MTPSELKKITAAVAQAAAALLARESNEDVTAESLAEELADSVVSEVVSKYEEIQAKAYNLIVLGHFRFNDDTSYVAAVGPLSTRAKARARDIGERFAWDYKTRRGTGKFVVVPLIRDPSQAWDKLRADQHPPAEVQELLRGVSVVPGVEPTYEAMRLGLSEEVRQRITADWEIEPEVLARKYGPHCLCGRYTFAKTTNLGDPVTPGCPRHPEKESEGDS